MRSMAKRIIAAGVGAALSLATLEAMPPDRKRELDEILFSYASFKQIYRNDPAAFVEDCFDWNQVKERPTTYQLDILDTLAKKKREAVRGPHGLGKTAINSWTVNWFGLTRDGLDWKVITTAGAWRQLTHFLWPEIHKWARLIRWDRVGRGPYVPKQELLDMALQLSTGNAFAVASDQPSLIEGAHADHLLYIYDESKAIADGTFDAAEGAFSGAGADTGREAYALATSTPGAPDGRFYAIHARKRGFADWTPRHVTVEEAKQAGRISQDWQDARREQWGEDSAIYKNRVLGEFAASDESGVIPLSWVEAAQDRWRVWKDAQAAKADPARKPKPLTAIGVDVAWEGSDRSTIAPRDGAVITDIEIYRKQDPLQTGERVVQIQKARGGVAIVDVIGLGAGTLLKIRELKQQAIGFVAGGKALGAGDKPVTDESGEIEFSDMRSAAWWHLRDLLNPARNHNIALPPDETLRTMPGEDPPSLTGELCAPTWGIVGGKIKVESKDEIYKRIKRSTDLADPIVQAFAKDFMVMPLQGTPIDIGSRPSRWSI
jgi:hypothetical protein